MYYENRHVVVTGTFKPLLLVVGAVVAPFAILLMRHAFPLTDVLGWVVLLAMLGALIGTVVGHLIDSAVEDVRAMRSRRGAERAWSTSQR